MEVGDPGAKVPLFKDFNGKADVPVELVWPLQEGRRTRCVDLVVEGRQSVCECVTEKSCSFTDYDMPTKCHSLVINKIKSRLMITRYCTIPGKAFRKGVPLITIPAVI